MYKFLCEHMASFFLGIELGIELLGHMVAIYIHIYDLFRNCQTVFYIGSTVLDFKVDFFMF